VNVVTADAIAGWVPTVVTAVRTLDRRRVRTDLARASRRGRATSATSAKALDDRRFVCARGTGVRGT